MLIFLLYLNLILHKKYYILMIIFDINVIGYEFNVSLNYCYHY